MTGDRDHVPPILLDSKEDSSYSLSGKIMVSVILILFFVVVLLIALHLYVRSHLLRFRRRQLSRRRTGLNEAHVRHRRPFQIVFTTTLTDSSDPGNRGLESSVLSSLPVFVYSAKNHPEPLDCAVCLSEFEENEKGRFLPKCNHSFHIECIDMWFHSHSTCPLCRAPVEPVPEPDNTIGSSERTENEPAGTSSGLCVACQHEEGNSSTSSSLRSRRKGLDVTIDVPLRTELEDELTLSSVGGGSRSPGTRLLSARMKRLLSIGGRKTPTSVRYTTPFDVESSNRRGGEVDLEKGRSELTPR